MTLPKIPPKILSLLITDVNSVWVTLPYVVYQDVSNNNDRMKWHWWDGIHKYKASFKIPRRLLFEITTLTRREKIYKIWLFNAKTKEMMCEDIPKPHFLPS